MFVSFLDAVGDLGVRPLVAVRGDDPIHRVPLGVPLPLRPLALRKLDLVDLLQEQRPVVVLVKDADDDADGGGLSGNAVVGDGDLGGEIKSFKTQIDITLRLLGLKTTRA